MTTFINHRLREEIEQGAQGGPTFMTTIMELAGGTEKRNIEWSRPRQEWDISYGISAPEDLDEVIDLFYVCYGRGYGFRFKDFTDYQIGDPDDAATAQVIAVAAGGTAFQIYKNYVVGSDNFLRKITRLVAATVKVYDNGVLKTETTHYTVGYDTGIITFLIAPTVGHSISVICEFDVPVRFDTDSLKKRVIWEQAQELPAITIKELKE